MKLRILFILPVLLSALVGCQRRPAAPTGGGPPVVTVSQPVERDVTDFIDYTGRTEAVNAVDIRARVTGYLVKMPFKEGDELKKDSLLFEIDPRPYQAQLDQAKSVVNLNKAQLKLAEANYARAKVIARTPGAISQQDLDTYAATVAEAEAQLEASESNVETYQLNRDFCEVTSPIDGKVSRYYYTLGNLVSQDNTLLTTIVSLDPMYAYFDIDERTLLRIRNRINQGTLRAIKSPEEITVLMGVQGEAGFPHEGHVNFINNTIDPFTGTITMRGVFDNPLPKVGVRLLSPGMFVRVRIPLGKPHPALLVNDRAVGTDQGLKYLYVVDDKNIVQYRRVTLGPLQEDGLRVVESGLEPGEWVVVSGLQQIRPRIEVSPEQVPMPIPSAAATAEGAIEANEPADAKGGSTGTAPSGDTPAGAKPLKSVKPTDTGKPAESGKPQRSEKESKHE